MPGDFFTPNENINLSPQVSDETKTTTCYMCAGKCGIKVHLSGGHIRYIEGNSDHPVNKGALCAKGSAGIMQQYSPARLTKPLRRTGERGSGDFEEIEWEEALTLVADRLKKIRSEDPRKLAFFTGRDQSQALTEWWATQFGTPNYATHGGFCSVNMAAAGLYTIGGSFWEFGEPDWESINWWKVGIVIDANGEGIFESEQEALDEYGVKSIDEINAHFARRFYDVSLDEEEYWVSLEKEFEGKTGLPFEQIRVNYG